MKYLQCCIIIILCSCASKKRVIENSQKNPYEITQTKDSIVEAVKKAQTVITSIDTIIKHEEVAPLAEHKTTLVSPIRFNHS